MDNKIFNGLKVNCKNQSRYDIDLSDKYAQKWKNLKNAWFYQSSIIDEDNNMIYGNGNNMNDQKQIIFSLEKDSGLISQYNEIDLRLLFAGVIRDFEKGYYFTSKAEIIQYDKDLIELNNLQLQDDCCGIHLGFDGNIYCSSANGIIYKISKDCKIINYLNVGKEVGAKIKKGLLNRKKSIFSKSFCMNENYLFVQGTMGDNKNGFIAKVNLNTFTVENRLIHESLEEPFCDLSISEDNKYLVAVTRLLSEQSYSVINAENLTILRTIPASFLSSLPDFILNKDNSIVFYHYGKNTLKKYDLNSGAQIYEFVNKNSFYKDFFGLTGFNNYIAFGVSDANEKTSLVIAKPDLSEEIFKLEVDIEGRFGTITSTKNGDNLLISSIKDSSRIQSRNLNKGLIYLEKINN
jgi:hypothetical protein